MKEVINQNLSKRKIYHSAELLDLKTMYLNVIEK